MFPNISNTKIAAVVVLRHGRLVTGTTKSPHEVMKKRVCLLNDSRMSEVHLLHIVNIDLSFARMPSMVRRFLIENLLRT